MVAAHTLLTDADVEAIFQDLSKEGITIPRPSKVLLIPDEDPDGDPIYTLRVEFPEEIPGEDASWRIVWPFLRRASNSYRNGLRRAISTAYYSLFHFIGEESTRLLFGGGPGDRMRSACSPPPSCCGRDSPGGGENDLRFCPPPFTTWASCFPKFPQHRNAPTSVPNAAL